MTIKYYTKQYAGMLPKIFVKRSHFMRTFGGQLQVRDGVSSKDKFIDLKITNQDVIVQPYKTGENDAFGTGTGSSNRFGERNEIKSIDAQVNYEAPLAIHEGIDNFTVNDIPDQVVAERMALHAEAWTGHLNNKMAAMLSENASETLNAELTEEGIKKVFNDARSKFVNNNVSKTIGRVAYVTAEVYNFLVDHKLTTTAKQSDANIATGEISMYKGFVLEEVADEYFVGDENIYFAADNVGIIGVGIQVTRAMDSEDFAGVALQAAAKYARYVPEKNKKAILKAVVAEALEG